jgi:hypothetical protein
MRNAKTIASATCREPGPHRVRSRQDRLPRPGASQYARHAPRGHLAGRITPVGLAIVVVSCGLESDRSSPFDGRTIRRARAGRLPASNRARPAKPIPPPGSGSRRPANQCAQARRRCQRSLTGWRHEPRRGRCDCDRWGARADAIERGLPDDHNTRQVNHLAPRRCHRTIRSPSSPTSIRTPRMSSVCSSALRV